MVEATILGAEVARIIALSPLYRPMVASLGVCRKLQRKSGITLEILT